MPTRHGAEFRPPAALNCSLFAYPLQPSLRSGAKKVRWIDQHVAELYGLTGQEIAIVEEPTGE